MRMRAFGSVKRLTPVASLAIDSVSFSVCSDLSCQNFTPVGAVARAVGQRLAIFIDTLAPPNGLTPSDLSSLITLFDSRLYAIDTLAFGRESDINQDSVVIVLMTNVVNRLVTAAECDANGAYVAGFFLGADIDPLFATDMRLNHLEVFYSIVPDPSGTLSCAHSVSQVTRFVPITFIHEFQHMISYNQHVLIRRRNGEHLWLNEGLSHYAEELGGRSFLAEGDNQTFTDYVIGDLYNAYKFLEAPGDFFLLPRTGIGELEERGAQWLFVRYLVDQFAAGATRADWDAFTRRLVQTGDTGATNVQVVTGTPFATTVGRWVLSNWVDDLPAFTTPAELTYESWNFRSTYAQLNSQNATRFPQPFPLVPTSSSGSAIDLSGRGYACISLQLRRERLGALSCENLPHFFSTLASAMRAARSPMTCTCAWMPARSRARIAAAKTSGCMTVEPRSSPPTYGSSSAAPREPRAPSA